MRRTQILLALSLIGCAPRLGQAIAYTNKGMAVLDVAITETTEIHADATRIAIRNCANVIKDGTEEQRTTCLRKQGFSSAQIGKLEEALILISDAYDTLAVALDAMKKALPVIDEALSNARKVNP